MDADQREDAEHDRSGADERLQAGGGHRRLTSDVGEVLVRAAHVERAEVRGRTAAEQQRAAKDDHRDRRQRPREHSPRSARMPSTMPAAPQTSSAPMPPPPSSARASHSTRRRGARQGAEARGDRAAVRDQRGAEDDRGDQR